MAIEQLQDILMSCGNKARWPELENRVKQLVVEQQTTGRGVSTVPIRQKAKAIAEEMDIEHFQGGRSWCFRFMRRRHLSIRARTTVAQRLPADYQERVAIFHTYCRDKITAPSHITNMDETPLTFDIPLTHKVEKKGPARWRYAQRGTKSRRSPWFSAATETDRALDDGRHMGYDTVFMYCKSFIKINAEAEPVGESDSDDEEEEFRMLDIEIAQLFNSDTEDENFDGFVVEE
ncbi:hypothetical protein D4764_03G0003020 [Takifugu flavidus]|uniref:HTH CENPB-type domain-containing protein n=1 Tax=Takifugu flavidus TaxID=433684 RepID=A0A5C6N713_9TELE|nr:hypothetical protein D4764_03G0003020 [Takifugu flavidus]